MGPAPRREVRPPWRIGLAALPVLASLSAASAGDAELQRALLGKACVASRVEAVLRQRSLVVYRAYCTGSPGETVDVLCARHRCSVNRPTARDER